MSDEDGDDDERPTSETHSRGSIRLRRGEFAEIAPGLLLWRPSSHVRIEHVEAFLSAADDLIGNDYRPHLFVDGADINVYDKEVRQFFEGWALRNRAQLGGVWLLYRSPILNMGLSISEAATGGAIRGFADAEEFNEVLRESIARARAGEYRKAPEPPSLDPGEFEG